MRIDILTIFPPMISGFLEYGVIGRAYKNGLLQVYIHDLRDFTKDKHRQVDDQTYGGGAGMVMKAEPFFEGVREISSQIGRDLSESRRILMSPAGFLLNQKKAKELAREDWIVLLCGRYEGVDARVEDGLCTDIISIGDYILSGGELPALTVIETVARLIPGVLGSQDSVLDETFEGGLLEYPQYTRPESFEGRKVPDVLLTGNHNSINEWRRRQAIKRTLQRRPDLLTKAHLKDEEIEWISSGDI